MLPELIDLLIRRVLSVRAEELTAAGTRNARLSGVYGLGSVNGTDTPSAVGRANHPSILNGRWSVIRLRLDTVPIQTLPLARR